MASNQENAKESPYRAMIPPTSTIPGSFMPSALPGGAGVFNPAGVQPQQATNDKTQQSAESMDIAAELTLQGRAMLTYHLFFTERDGIDTMILLLGHHLV